MYKDIDIDEALADYQTVYQASWKANEFFSGFTPALVKRLSKLNWLRMAILYADQQAVAAQIWFVVHGLRANEYFRPTLACGYYRPSVISKPFHRYITNVCFRPECMDARMKEGIMEDAYDILMSAFDPKRTFK